MVQRVRRRVGHPLGDQDADQDREQHAHVVAHLQQGGLEGLGSVTAPSLVSVIYFCLSQTHRPSSGRTCQVQRLSSHGRHAERLGFYSVNQVATGLEASPRDGARLHHDDGQADGEPRDAAHERAGADQRERTRVHPRPGAGRQEDARRRSARVRASAEACRSPACRGTLGRTPSHMQLHTSADVRTWHAASLSAAPHLLTMMRLDWG